MPDPDSKIATIAIIGAGEMGSAVGRRLREMGGRVLTETEGRSSESVERVRRAGLEVIDDDEQLIRESDFVLSIVPPGVAVQVAERFRAPLSRSNPKPGFVECNAIAPATVHHIHALLEASGCMFVDAGIIGGPPPAGAENQSKGPRFYASGPDAQAFAALTRYGLDIAVMDAPIGAASGLKLSYAGLTKGLTALGAAMVGAAMRDGLGDALKAELARSQPDLLHRVERFVPAMVPKAYRWVAEMEEIARFLASNGDGAMIYEGAARLYEQVAAEVERGGDSGRIASLNDFCTRRS